MLKVAITLLFSALFSMAQAQHHIGLRAELGGTYRWLASDYPFLNEMYNVHETPKVGVGAGLEYSYRVGERWLLQSSLGIAVKGFQINITDDYLGEFRNDNSFLKTNEATIIRHDFVRAQVAAMVSYFLKTSADWHVILGAGPALNYQITHLVRQNGSSVDQELSKPTSFGLERSYIPGVQIQFGWLNTLPNGNEVMFVIRYDQDVTPVLETPIRRYLTSLNFTFYYLFEV